MTEFERTLRDHMNEAWTDVYCNEDYTPAEIDAYTLGARHAIEEAAHLFEVAANAEYERARDHYRRSAVDIDAVFSEVRTGFAVEWEHDKRPASDLTVVGEVLDYAYAVIDAMEDCE